MYPHRKGQRLSNRRGTVRWTKQTLHPKKGGVRSLYPHCKGQHLSNRRGTIRWTKQTLYPKKGGGVGHMKTLLLHKNSANEKRWGLCKAPPAVVFCTSPLCTCKVTPRGALWKNSVACKRGTPPPFDVANLRQTPMTSHFEDPPLPVFSFFFGRGFETFPQMSCWLRHGPNMPHQT